MILTAFHGFCMALADSVPGVSGGTIAFIPFIAAELFQRRSPCSAWRWS